MKRALVVAVVAAMIVTLILIASSCGGGGGSTDTTAAPGTTAASGGGGGSGGGAEGATLFASNCTPCHGAQGQGGQGPDLRPFTESDLQRIVKQVTNGGGGMPAFGGALTQEQIDSVATYVAGLQ